MQRQPKVSVAILTAESIKFELHGDYSSPDGSNSLNGKYRAELDGEMIKISNSKEKILVKNDFTLEPADIETESFLIRDVIIGIQFHWEQKENQRFLGSLKFIIENNKITAVNILPVEDYLTSVISSEMNANSSVEFLKAHSIISRSWLLAQMSKSKSLKSKETVYQSKIETEDELIRWFDREDHTLYDVCADDHCQRYQGITKLYAHNAQTAVVDTAGLVLEYDGKICDTRFSKACGGIAEAFENVWEPIKHPYLDKVIDYKFEPENFDLDLTKENAAQKWIKKSPPAFCNTKDQKILSQVLQDYDLETTDFYRWKVEYSQSEISELINKRSEYDFGQIIDLIPIERGVSGRLIKLKVVGKKKTLTFGKELIIRKILSESHLYSSAFVVEKQDVADGIPGKFILYGAGWGHGVGLCQIGAAVMSEMGYNFDEILLHYFRGAKIKKIY